MAYTILCSGKVIARFENEHDRDLSLDALAEFYDDMTFEVGEEKD